MKKLKTIMLLISISFTYGQQKIDQVFINKIDFGYTTRWDIEQLIGKGEYLKNQITGVDNEQDYGKKGYTQYNGLKYAKTGVTFVCADDGEKISSIRFTKPYIGNFVSNKIIEVGVTKIKDIFPRIDTITTNTTGASSYLSFQQNGFFFYVEKPNEDKNKKIYSDVPELKDNLDYYNNQPIKIITIEKWNYDSSNFEPIGIGNGLLGIKPIYAPKNVKHLNCYEMGWPNNIPTIFIPFYAMTGGGKSEKIKQGYWIDYAPNHKISWEGSYKDNQRIGAFKYYDSNGNFINTETYKPFPSLAPYIYAIFGIIILWLIIKKIRVKKNVT
jgi:hypothetical protein